tara:strand:- start:75 stop:554 length:480 start_codon:yes stop_codon:yes gene_type:complete
VLAARLLKAYSREVVDSREIVDSREVVPMAAEGEADDLAVVDLLSLHVDLLSHIAKALPHHNRLAFSLTARPLNAARMSANLNLKTCPRKLMGGTPALVLWAVSIGCPERSSIEWAEEFDQLGDQEADREGLCGEYHQYTYLEELGPRMRCMYTCAHEP